MSDREHVEVALRESERRLAQAQKMEAVGQLTGGIALMAMTSGRFSRSRRMRLGSQLTEQLLTFARQRQLDPRIVCLNDLVIDVADMLRRTLSEPLQEALGLWLVSRHAARIQTAVEGGCLFLWVQLFDAQDERRACTILLTHCSIVVEVHDLAALPPASGQ